MSFSVETYMRVPCYAHYKLFSASHTHLSLSRTWPTFDRRKLLGEMLEVKKNRNGGGKIDRQGFVDVRHFPSGEIRSPFRRPYNRFPVEKSASFRFARSNMC